MKTTNNTALVSGGSAGIGLEIAKLLDAAGNKVIITGRNAERLQKAAALLPNAVAIVSDVSKAEDSRALAERLQHEFPQLNMVINNAAAASVYSLLDEEILDMATQEINTNYLSVLSLNHRLLPILRRQAEAAIVNVSSVAAYVPGNLAGLYLCISQTTGCGKVLFGQST